MSINANSTAASKALAIGIIVIQLFDITIHAATDQLEPIRVTSNLIVLLWSALMILGGHRTRLLTVAVGSVGIYFLLNVIFLAREGLTNPGQGGALRTTLLLLVFLTITLSAWLTYIHKNRLTQ